METVRAINTSKGSKQPRIPRAQELPQGTLTEGAGYHFTPAPGGVGLPEEGGSVNRSQPGKRNKNAPFFFSFSFFEFVLVCEFFQRF